MFKRLHISKWLGGLFAPIEKNGAFFVFMFVLGYLCTQLEIMPYYLRDRGAKPYELSVPELFLDIYVVCVLKDPYLCQGPALCALLWCGHRGYVLL